MVLYYGSKVFVWSPFIDQGWTQYFAKERILFRNEMDWWLNVFIMFAKSKDLKTVKFWTLTKSLLQNAAKSKIKSYEFFILYSGSSEESLGFSCEFSFSAGKLRFPSAAVKQITQKKSKEREFYNFLSDEKGP